MTREDKELLLKDLCARLPYGVKIHNEIQGDFEIYGICAGYIYGRSKTCHIDFSIEKIKPYLIPLSSMTEEQKEDLLIHVLSKEEDCKYFQVLSDGSIDSTDAKQQELEFFNFRWVNFDSKTTSAYIDFCNKNHIDYRNLIGKNLAIDATGLNIY